MARATSLWVVQDVDGNITHAFSVKHELQSFLAQLHSDLVKVTYLPDGNKLTYTSEGGYVFNNGKVPVQVDPETLQPLKDNNG